MYEYGALRRISKAVLDQVLLDATVDPEGCVDELESGSLDLYLECCGIHADWFKREIWHAHAGHDGLFSATNIATLTELSLCACQMRLRDARGVSTRLGREVRVSIDEAVRIFGKDVKSKVDEREIISTTIYVSHSMKSRLSAGARKAHRSLSHHVHHLLTREAKEWTKNGKQ